MLYIIFLYVILLPLIYSNPVKMGQSITIQKKQSINSKFDQAELWNGIIQSSKLEPKSLELTSTSVMVAGFISAALSLFTFNLLTDKINQGAIAQGFKGDVKDLLIFDLRNGYTNDCAANLLKSWTPSGRMLYLLIESIDVTFYHCGYRAAFLILFNKITHSLASTRFPYTRHVKKLGYLAIILSVLDMVEDIFQVLTTIIYHVDASNAGSYVFNTVVRCASAMNQIKWWAVSVIAPIFATTAVTLVVSKAAAQRTKQK